MSDEKLRRYERFNQGNSQVLYHQPSLQRKSSVRLDIKPVLLYLLSQKPGFRLNRFLRYGQISYFSCVWQICMAIGGRVHHPKIDSNGVYPTFGEIYKHHFLKFKNFDISPHPIAIAMVQWNYWPNTFGEKSQSYCSKCLNKNTF